MRRAWWWSAALIVAGCAQSVGPADVAPDTGRDAVSEVVAFDARDSFETVADAGIDIASEVEADVSEPDTYDPRCADATPLIPGVPRVGERLEAPDGGSAERLYALRIAPRSRAVVTLTSEDSAEASSLSFGAHAWCELTRQQLGPVLQLDSPRTLIIENPRLIGFDVVVQAWTRTSRTFTIIAEVTGYVPQPEASCSVPVARVLGEPGELVAGFIDPGPSPDRRYAIRLTRRSAVRVTPRNLGSSGAVCLMRGCGPAYSSTIDCSQTSGAGCLDLFASAVLDPGDYFVEVRPRYMSPAPTFSVPYAFALVIAAPPLMLRCETAPATSVLSTDLGTNYLRPVIAPFERLVVRGVAGCLPSSSVTIGVASDCGAAFITQNDTQSDSSFGTIDFAVDNHTTMQRTVVLSYAANPSRFNTTTTHVALHPLAPNAACSGAIPLVNGSMTGVDLLAANESAQGPRSGYTLYYRIVVPPRAQLRAEAMGGFPVLRDGCAGRWLTSFGTPTLRPRIANWTNDTGASRDIVIAASGTRPSTSVSMTLTVSVSP